MEPIQILQIVAGLLFIVAASGLIAITGITVYMYINKWRSAKH